MKLDRVIITVCNNSTTITVSKKNQLPENNQMLYLSMCPWSTKWYYDFAKASSPSMSQNSFSQAQAPLNVCFYCSRRSFYSPNVLGECFCCCERSLSSWWPGHYQWPGNNDQIIEIQIRIFKRTYCIFRDVGRRPKVIRITSKVVHFKQCLNGIVRIIMARFVKKNWVMQMSSSVSESAIVANCWNKVPSIQTCSAKTYTSWTQRNCWNHVNRCVQL
jgi:hypothetical protein